MISLSPSPTATLVERFSRVRAQTEFLCAPLRAEDTVVQPIVDVSPPKWHMGHVTWFFEAFLLSEYVADYQVFHPRFAYLFNSYYEGAGERIQRAYRGNMTRPTRDEILAYRHHVTQHVLAYLNNGQEKSERELFILEIGMQHEQQHQELLVYDIKYILGHNPLFPAYQEEAYVSQPGQTPLTRNFLEVESGVYTIGHDGQGFHFDNERGQHRVFVERYGIMDRLITNGEFMAFIAAGGYGDYRLWLEEGWRWVNTEQIESPFYWFNLEGVWHHVTLHGLEPVDPAAPMTHLNFYEADAFAKWCGKRLPTEAEWEIAARTFAPVPPPEANFVDQQHFRPIPRQGQDYQFWGDVWEWTNSAYLPYPFYQPEDGTLGEYNGKFMINQMVLRGGSCATPRDHIRLTYRNFFHPHLRWLFNGFRLAETKE